MPRILRKLKIAEISTADRGAGEGCQIVLRKADSEATLGFHKDAEGRNVIRIADLAGVAKVLGVKPSRVMKALRKLAKKQAEPKPTAKVIPMPSPPPAPETETPYIKLCKYAAAEARPNETAEQAFARVATTDPRGVDLRTAAKVADVAKLLAEAAAEGAPGPRGRAGQHPHRRREARGRGSGRRRIREVDAASTHTSGRERRYDRAGFRADVAAAP
jgi:hypothetical protein